MKLELRKLQQVFPQGRPEMLVFLSSDRAAEILGDADINTSRRICNFLAQVGHESGGFKWNGELGGKTYFLKYENRKDLGNTQPGDGYKYRGRGPIQLTGRANYTKYGKLLGLDLVNNPDLVFEPEVGLKVATLYWTMNNLNVPADVNNVKTITRRINGGLNGLQDRINYLNKLEKLF